MRPNQKRFSRSRTAWIHFPKGLPSSHHRASLKKKRFLLHPMRILGVAVRGWSALLSSISSDYCSDYSKKKTAGLLLWTCPDRDLRTTCGELLWRIMKHVGEEQKTDCRCALLTCGVINFCFISTSDFSGCSCIMLFCKLHWHCKKNNNLDFT